MANFLFEYKTLNYLEKGKGDLLIILPGNTASSIAHQSQIDILSEYFHTVSLDYLGTGKSERTQEIKDNWWKYASEQIDSLISHLGYQKANLAGTSGGAIVALHAAANYPDKINRLILDSFSIRFSRDMFIKNVINTRKEISPDQEGFWKFCHGEDWKEVIDWDTKNIERIVEQGGYWLEKCLDKIKCPTLLLGSESDEFLPNIKQEFETLSNQIPECHFVLTSIGNHPLMWTNTQFYIYELKKFLKI